MRWAIVLVLAGCFSKPDLRDRDGGGGVDGGSGDGGGGDGGTTDGGTFDSPIAGCTWTPRGIIVDGASDERHPWLSSDGLFVMYWVGDVPGTTGAMWQAERTAVGQSFGAAIQIFPQPPGTTPAEADPSFQNGLLKMYIHSSSTILSSTRAMERGVFQNLATDSDLSAVTSTRDIQEGAFITSDDKTFLFAGGDSVDTYDSEDLYIATRSSGSGPFGTPKPFEHNVAGKNEGAPTMAGNVLMYERPSTNGKTEIVSSIWNGTNFSPPEVVVLPGTNSFKQPSLSANGQHLVYVVALGNDYHIEEAELSCP